MGGEGRSQYTPLPSNPQTDVSGASAPLLGLGAKLGLKWEQHGAWYPERARSFFEKALRVLCVCTLVIWSLGFPKTSGHRETLGPLLSSRMRIMG